jgi:ABC-type polysaccharide/polyol phosphate export permease
MNLAAQSHRDLLRALVARNLRIRYQRSTLGLAWSLLNPGLTIVVIAVVFQSIVRIGVEDYWMFLLSGYFAWVFLQHTVTASTSAFTEHASMLRTLAVPPEILVVGVVVSRFVEFLVELALVAVVLAVVRHGTIPVSFLALPLASVLLLTMVLALSLPVAAGAVFFRDIAFALPVALTLIGYLSPVYYPISLVPPDWVRLFELNPLARLFTLFHTILYQGAAPAPGDWAVVTAYGVILLGLGYAAFRWRRRLIPEVV